VSNKHCEDFGTCHHACPEGYCFRKDTGCLPLAGSGLNDNWSNDIGTEGIYYPDGLDYSPRINQATASLVRKMELLKNRRIMSNEPSMLAVSQSSSFKLFTEEMKKVPETKIVPATKVVFLITKYFSDLSANCEHKSDTGNWCDHVEAEENCYCFIHNCPLLGR
jgi:hypothetical protein